MPRTEAIEGLLTLEEYERLPDDGYRDELVRGRLVREPLPGGIHDWVAGNLFRSLDRYAEQHSLGHVAFDTGFLLSRDPPTVRGPDVAFLAWERIPSEGPPKGFWETAPDLAVEVLSMSNRAAEINDKVLEYLGAGTRLVWVVDPETRCVTVYRSRKDVQVLTTDDALDGADVLPGFRLPLSELFDLQTRSRDREAEDP
ncbi:MAG: Uma2 family endonuclease [Gemmatimonadota bacterium]